MRFTQKRFEGRAGPFKRVQIRLNLTLFEWANTIKFNLEIYLILVIYLELYSYVIIYVNSVRITCEC